MSAVAGAFETITLQHRWPMQPISKVVTFYGGGTPSKQRGDFWGGDIPWVSPKDMKSDVVTESIDNITPAAVDGSAVKMIPAGALLVVVRSGILARTVPIARAGVGLTINQDLKALVPSPSLDASFLTYFMQSAEGHLLAVVSRGATVHRLETDALKSLEIPLPPLAEQRRIVAKLDQAFAALDRACANAEANLGDARQLFDAEIQLAFERAAEGRRMLPFDSLCEALTPKLKLKRQDYLADGAYPVVSQEADLISGYWNDASAVLEKEGDVVVFGDHTCCLKYVDFDFVVGADGTKVLQPSNGISGKFLYYGLRSQPIQQTGYARHFKLLREKALPELSMPEQKRITDHLDQMEARCVKLSEAYESKLKDIAALRQSLLQAAFSGQLT